MGTHSTRAEEVVASRYRVAGRIVFVLFVTAVLLHGWQSASAEQGWYATETDSGRITASATIRYSGDQPYLAMDELLSDLGGTLRMLEDRAQINIGGLTAVVGIHGTNVTLPGSSFALQYPALTHQGVLYLAQTDIPTFFAQAFQKQLVPMGPPTDEVLPVPVEPMEPSSDSESPPMLTPLDSGLHPLAREDSLLLAPGPQRPAEALPSAPMQPPVPEASSTPPFPKVSGILVIDPGHGGQNSGAIGPGGLQEKEAVLEVALRLRRILKETTNLSIHLSREEDKDVPVNERLLQANTLNASLFLSLHAGYWPTPQAKGMTLFTDRYPENVALGNEQEVEARKQRGERAATIAGKMLRVLSEQENVGPAQLRGAPLKIQRGAQMPCILIEMAYISHPESEAMLADDAQAERLAWNLANALAQALSE